MYVIALILSVLFLVSIPVCIVSWFSFCDRLNTKRMKHYARGVYAEQKIQLIIWKRLFELLLLRCFTAFRREEDLFRLAACSHEALQAFVAWRAEVEALTVEDTWAISVESKREKLKELAHLEHMCQRPVDTLQVLCEQRIAEYALGEWCVQDASNYLATLHQALVDADERLNHMQHTYLHYSEYQELLDQICNCMGDEALCAYWIEAAQGEYVLHGVHTAAMVTIAKHTQHIAIQLEKNIAHIAQRLQSCIDQAASVKPRIEKVRQKLNMLMQTVSHSSEQTVLKQNIFLLSAWVDKAEKTCKFGLPVHARYASVYLEHAEYLLTVVEMQMNVPA